MGGSRTFNPVVCTRDDRKHRVPWGTAGGGGKWTTPVSSPWVSAHASLPWGSQCRKGLEGALSLQSTSPALTLRPCLWLAVPVLCQAAGLVLPARVPRSVQSCTSFAVSESCLMMPRAGPVPEQHTSANPCCLYLWARSQTDTENVSLLLWEGAALPRRKLPDGPSQGQEPRGSSALVFCGQAGH